MGGFLLPTSLCDEIEKIMNSFYWGSKKNGARGINWMRWDKLTLHKKFRGLGFVIWKPSTYPCSVCKVGNSYLIRLLYLLMSSKPNISHEGISWMPLWVIIQATHGEVFGVLNIYLLWGIDGRLVMAQKLMCGICLGCATYHLSNRPLLLPLVMRT
jgi:hypothetical protein